jgi:drug/metabolite transporter (DMT)-like permease
MPVRHLVSPLMFILLWTGNNLVTKLSAGAVSPGMMGFARWGGALVVLAPFVARATWSHRRAIQPHLPKLAFLGFLGLGVGQGLIYYAAKTVPATTIGIFVSFVPLLTIGLGIVLLREWPTPVTILGSLLSLTGVAYILGRGNPVILLRQGIGAGEGVLLLAYLAYATYSVLLKKWALPIPRWPALFVQICFATLFLFPVYLITPSEPVTASGAVIISYAAVLASVIAPYLWMHGIGLIGPARMASFANLVPILTALAAVAFLGETPHKYLVYGGCLIIFGVFLAQWGSRESHSGQGMNAASR